MVDWQSLIASKNYDAIAASILATDKQIDVAALCENPRIEIPNQTDLTIEEQGTLPATCIGGGYFDSSTKTIYVQPSGWRRDNFTLLHELGHHLQSRHDEWSYVLMDDIDQRMVTGVEERVSDCIAAQILLGKNIPNEHSDLEILPALVMARMFTSTTQASRSVVLEQVFKSLPPRWILAIADVNGIVIHARSNLPDRYPPAKDSTQPGFTNLARESQASKGLVIRSFNEGIVYKKELELDGLKAQAILDDNETNAFIALTPIHKYSTGTISENHFTCDQPGCETEDFTGKENLTWCEKGCHEPFCPTCGHCKCEAGTTGQYCDKCSLQITPYEAKTNSHECPF